MSTDLFDVWDFIESFPGEFEKHILEERKDSLFADAITQLASLNFVKSLSTLREHVKKKPSDNIALYFLTSLEHKIDPHPNIDQNYQKCLALCPDSLNALIKCGQIQLKTHKNYKAALPLFQKAYDILKEFHSTKSELIEEIPLQKRDKINNSLYIPLAFTLIELEQYQEAYKILKIAEKMSSKSCFNLISLFFLEQEIGTLNFSFEKELKNLQDYTNTIGSKGLPQLNKVIQQNLTCLMSINHKGDCFGFCQIMTAFEQQNDKKLIHLQRAIKKTPKNTSFRFLLCIELLAQNKIEWVIDEMKLLLAKPGLIYDTDGYLLLGSANKMKQNSIQDAIQIYQDIIKKSPDNKKSVFSLAQIYIEQEQYDLAESVFLTYKDQIDSDHKVYFKLAALYAKLNKYKEAVSQAQIFLKKSPKLKNKQGIILADIFFLADDPSGVKQVFQKCKNAKEIATSTDDQFEQFGDLAIKHKQWKTAEYFFEEQCKATPTISRHFYTLAFVYEQQGQQMKYTNHLTKILEKFIADEHLLDLLTEAYIKSNQWNRIAKLVVEWIKKFPGSKKPLPVLYKLAMSFVDLNPTTSNFWFEKYLELDKESADVNLKIGVNLLNLKFAENAAEYLKKAVSLDSKLFEAHLLLAQYYVKKNEIELAKQSLEKILEINPTHSTGLNELAGILFKEKKLKEAKLLLKRSLESSDQDSMTYLLLSKYYKKRNKPIKQEVFIKKMIEKSPKGTLERITFGYFCYSKGNLDEAFRLLEKLDVPEKVQKYFYILGVCQKQVRSIPIAFRSFEESVRAPFSKYFCRAMEEVIQMVQENDKIQQWFRHFQDMLRTKSVELKKDPVIDRLLGRFYFKINDFKKAKQSFDSFLKSQPIGPMNVSNVFLARCDLILTKNITYSEEFIARIDAIDGADVRNTFEYRILCAEVSLRKGDNDSVIEFVTKELERDEYQMHSEELNYLRARAQVQSGSHEKEIRESFKIGAKYPPIRWLEAKFNHDKLSRTSLRIAENCKESLKQFEAVYKMDNQFIPNIESMANLNFQLNNLEKSIEYFNQVLEFYEAKDIYILEALSDCYFRKKDYSQSINYLHQALAISPMKYECLQNKGIALYYLNNFNPALDSLQVCYSMNNKDGKNIYFMSLCEKNLGLFSDSTVHDDISTISTPRMKLYLDWMCKIYTKGSDNHHFRKQFIDCFQIDPDHSRLLLKLGESYALSQGSLKGAIQKFPWIILPKTSNLLENLQVILDICIQSEDFKNAQYIFEDNLESLEKNVPEFFQISEFCYNHLHSFRIEPVLKYYTRIEQLLKKDNPASPIIQIAKLRQAQILFISRKFIESNNIAFSINASKSKNIEFFEIYFLRGQNSLVKGNYKEALRYFTKCRKLYPTNIETIFTIANIIRERNTERAERIITKEVSKVSSTLSGQSLILYAWVLLVRSERKYNAIEVNKAKQLLDQAFEYDNNSEYYQFVLGQYYMIQKDFNAALISFNQCIENSSLPLKSVFSTQLSKSQMQQCYFNIAKAKFAITSKVSALEPLFTYMGEEIQDKNILKFIISVYKSAGDFHSAIRFAKQANDVCKGDPNILYTIGELNMQLYDYNSALFYFNRCHVVDNSYPNIVITIAETQEKNGSINCALNNYWSILSFKDPSPIILLKCITLLTMLLNYRYAHALINQYAAYTRKPLPSEIILARAYLEKRQGNMPAAIESMQLSITANPLNVQAIFSLGINLHESRRYQEEIALYESSLPLIRTDKLKLERQNDSNDNILISKILNSYGNVLVKTGNTKQALLQYESALEYNKKSHHILQNIGVCQLALNQIKQAKHSFIASIKLKNFDLNSIVYLSIAQAKEGQIELAIKGLCKCLNFDPTFSFAAINLSILLCKQNKFEESVNTLLPVVKSQPFSINASYHLAISYYRLKDYPAAIKLIQDMISKYNTFVSESNKHEDSLEPLLRIFSDCTGGNNKEEEYNLISYQANGLKHPTKVMLNLFLASSYGKQNMRENQLRVLEKCRAEEVDNSDVYLSYILTMVQEKKFNFEFELNQCLQLNPSKKAVYLVIVSNHFHQQKQYELEIKYLKLAILTNPLYYPAYDNLGVVYMILEQYYQAILLFQQSASISPGKVNSHFNLGNAYYKTNQFNLAIDSYLQATLISPNHLQSYQNIAIAYLRTNKRDPSIQAYQKCSEIDSQNLEVYQKLIQRINAQYGYNW